MQPYQKDILYVLPILLKSLGMGILIAPVHTLKNVMN